MKMKEQMMARRTFLKVSGFTLTCSLAGNAFAKAKKRPNILFILPDQFRRSAMNFWSKPAYAGALGDPKRLVNQGADPVVTEGLDKFADESIVLTQAISNCPLCSPYRAMLMSGRYPSSNGMGNNNSRKDRDCQLSHDLPCLTDVLYRQGYNTGYVGKTHWHRTEPLFDSNNNFVGTESSPGGHFANTYDTYIPPGPSRHSVEYWRQTIKDSHKDPFYYTGDNGKARRDTGVFSPVHESEQVIDYIKNEKKLRDQNKPFCLFWCPNPPHNPYNHRSDTDEAVYDKYYSKSIFADEKKLLNRPNCDVDGYKDKARVYFSHITAIDQEVARILTALDEKGLSDNTIVVFTSDHGETMGSNCDMAKNVIYEESLGVPFMIRYPSRLKHRIDDILLSVPDIMPTLLGLCDLSHSIPEGVQGTDYSSYLLKPQTFKKTTPKSAIYLGGRKKRGVRTDRFTLEISEKTKTEYDELLLFDNIADPYQQKPLALSDITKSDANILCKEFGKRLAIAGDPWFIEKRYQDLIIYP